MSRNLTICHLYSAVSLCYNNVIVLFKCHRLKHMTMQEETRTRINENGRVVIPASFRKALGINIGDEVVLRIEDDELRISTLKRRIERAQRLVRQHVKPGASLVDELIAERREAAKRE
jgi:AbrB family looped-hinge helix DNA binding protein